MADRVVQTGVTLRCVAPDPAHGKELEIAAEVWVEVERDGVLCRNGGQTAFGDARIAGADVTRFECYAAPFRVELDDRLRAVLVGLGTSAIPATSPRVA